MPTHADPIVGEWYENLDKGQKFQVVALSEDDGLVEIQHYDGDVEELDIDTWYEMDAEPIEAPEDWDGAMDNAADDEEPVEDPEVAVVEKDWRAPAKKRQSAEDDSEEWEEEEPDEWGEGNWDQASWDDDDR